MEKRRKKKREGRVEKLEKILYTRIWPSYYYYYYFVAKETVDANDFWGGGKKEGGEKKRGGKMERGRWSTREQNIII